MRIHCPHCRKLLNVPEERTSNPNLKVQCGGCQAVFYFSQASLALRAPDPSAPEPAAGVSAAEHATLATAPSAHAATRAPHAASATRPAAGTTTAAARTSAHPPTVASHPPVIRPADGSLARGGWQRCANHPHAATSSVCPVCQKGYCVSCEQRVQSAVVCPGCEGLCVPIARHAESQRVRERRARSMGRELRTISGYPLVDGVAFVLLALFSWIFGLFKGWNAIALLFSNGILMMYSFAAVSKVSGGNLDEYMPDFRDISDLARPLRLGFAALLVSAGPLIVVVLSVPAAALLVPGLLGDAPSESALRLDADDPEPLVAPPAVASGDSDEDEALAAILDDDAQGGTTDAPEPPSPAVVGVQQAALGTGLLALFVLAMGWKIVYTPVALTVAALTRSFWQTLNPVLGIQTILRMGGTYWQAAGIYTVIAAAQWGLGLALGLIPIAGGLVGSFVDAYAYLAIGCTLGLAVYKKAPELGLD